MATPVAVTSLFEFGLSGHVVGGATLDFPAPVTALGAGNIMLPDDPGLWVELGFDAVEGVEDVYEPYVISGSMGAEWMNPFYGAGGEMSFFYAFSRTVFGSPDAPIIGSGYVFPTDAASFVGLLLPTGIEPSSVVVKQHPDGDGGWACGIRMFGTFSQADVEQIRVYITAAGEGEPGPPPNFWTNFVGSREIS